MTNEQMYKWSICLWKKLLNEKLISQEEFDFANKRLKDKLDIDNITNF